MESDKNITTEISPKNQDPITFFEKDAVFVFAFKKTEKLASAVYMITNLFSDNEPIKWSLRKKSGELVSFTLAYKDIKDSNLYDFSYEAKSKVLELVSLLEVSFRAGLISNMNFSIIKQEFSNLLSVFSTTQNQPKEQSYDNLTKTFFEVTDNRSAVSDRHVSISHPAHVVIKDKENLSDRDGFKRSNRQNIILGLLKKKKELTIKDIALVIKDCSEKTIQRELISFIEAGVLKRTGERRWSKYSLV